MQQKTVFITGAGRGIGLKMAEVLAQQGYHLILNYRKEQSKAAANLYQFSERWSSSIKVTLALADIAVPREVTQLMKRLSEQGISQIDHLLLNAASAPFKRFASMTHHDWKLLFETNLIGNNHCVNEIVPLMPKGSSICFLSSLGSHIALPGYPLGIVKAAIESLARYLEIELTDKDIRVNAVCAGLVNTDMLPFLKEQWPDVIDSLSKKNRRWLVEPEEVANIAAFLISDKASAIRGTTIFADLGTTLTL